MLKRLFICLVLVGAPLSVAAQSVEEQIVSQLRDQGYQDIVANRTWLGRVRVVAVRGNRHRELVFNPLTGEILRDYWDHQNPGDGSGPSLINPGGNDDGGSSSDKGDTGNDDQHDSNDDHQDDAND